MLRIITQQRDVLAELQRIRTQDKLKSQEQAYEQDLLEKITKIQRTLLDFQKNKVNVPIFPLNGADLDTAYQKIPTGLLDGLRTCCRQLEAFYQQRIPKNWVNFGENETVLGKKYQPVTRAGFYVESLGSLLTQAIPAKVAKVPQKVMVTPLDHKHSHYYAILVAAQEIGIEEVYQMEGAEAIAILAYGSSNITPVEIITGSGNEEVILAKQLVSGTVMTDIPVKNADLVIIADETAKASQISADLVAQAEQYPTSGIILLTPDPKLAQEVQQRIQEQLQDSPSSILTEKALAHYGLIVVVSSLEEAVKLIGEINPYFLLLEIADPWDYLDQIKGVRVIFLGHNTPKATGDYLGGSALVYPFSGSIRMGTQVSVETFLKPTHLIEYSEDALQKFAHTLQLLAQAEGLLTKEETIRKRIEES